MHKVLEKVMDTDTDSKVLMTSPINIVKIAIIRKNVILNHPKISFMFLINLTAPSKPKVTS